MTENQITPTIGTDDRGAPVLGDLSAVASGLSESGRAMAKDQFLKAGFDEAAVNKMLGINAQDTQQEAVSSTQLDAWKLPELSGAELKKAADYLRQHWTLDPAILDQAVKDAEARTAKAVDMSIGGVDPSEYSLDGLYVNRGSNAVGDVAALDGELRVALSAMEIPVVQGRGVASELLDSANEFERVRQGPEARLQLWKRQQRADLERIGRQSADNLTAWAAHALSRVPAETRAMLLDHGALETAIVVLRLAEQGRRLLQKEQLAAQRGK